MTRRISGFSRSVRSSARLSPVGDVKHALVDQGDGAARGRDLDPRRLVQHGRGEVGDLGGHGRREQHRLSRLRQLGHDLADVADEAHVEHPVGLVEHEGRDARSSLAWPCWMRSRRRPGVATRMSIPARKPATCGSWPTPPWITAVRRAQAFAVGGEGRGHLDGELAGRNEDERGCARGRAAAAFRQAAAGSAARTPRSCRCRFGRSRAGLGLRGEAGWRAPGSALRYDSRRCEGRAEAGSATPRSAKEVNCDCSFLCAPRRKVPPDRPATRRMQALVDAPGRGG